LASAGNDMVVRLWDMATGKQRGALEGHVGWITSVAFSLDGRLLASGSTDKTVRLWDMAIGKPVRIFAGHTNQVSCVAFAPSGKLLASGTGAAPTGSGSTKTRFARGKTPGEIIEWDLTQSKAAGRPDGHS